MADNQMTKEELQSALELMGVKVHHNANLKTLQQAFDEAKATPLEGIPVDSLKTDHKAHLIMKRYKISCMNPVKRDWTGEIFTAGNDRVGTVRKFVPYNCIAAEAWHIPAIIVEGILAQKYLEITMKKDRNGHDYVSKAWKPSFVLSELPELSVDEMQRLAHHQRLVSAADTEGEQY